MTRTPARDRLWPDEQTILPDVTGSGMAPQASKWDLRRNYTYGAEARRQQVTQQQHAELQDRIVKRCDDLGLLVHYQPDARLQRPGFPDLVIAGPGGFAAVELKSDTGRMTKQQARWGAMLQGTYHGWFLWRPGNWYPGGSAPLLLARLTGT